MAGSASETRIVAVEARAEGADCAALAVALGQILPKLAAEGATPADLASMVWMGPDPAALHPSRREVDAVWREAFAGFRPPVRLARVADGAVTVRAVAHVAAQPAPQGPVFRGYDAAEVARQMSPRGQVPNMGAVFAQWKRDGAAARARHAGRDLVYGPGPFQTLDLYRPTGVERPPVWVFIHGGYWQASSKDQHAQFCSGMLKAGYAVANIDYGLAPETPLAQIVTQVRDALHFLVREAENLAVDAGRLHVAGHSAGGHLAAWLACDPEAPPVKSAHPLSGVLDLEPLLHIPMGRILGLDAAAAARLSPVNLTPRPGVRAAFAVGAVESDEFKRQSAECAARWGAPPPLVVEGANHFGLLDGLIEGPLLRQSIELCREA
ncbi:MAG TPA: alpha/beta hydrolase [Beijerinckiaceae bacterium]|jgi:arylformamidase